MIASQRKQFIQEMLKKNQAVIVAELVDLLEVSKETIRRDLEDLENNKLLVRVHGGAVPAKRMYQYEDINARIMSNMALKKQLAETAIKYIKDGDCIAIDSGTTASVFAMELKKRQFESLSIVTYSSEVFSILSDCPNYRVTVSGGDYLPREKIFYGFLANEAMKKLYFTKSFVVPLAISLEDGAHDCIREVYENQRILLSHADEVFILADSSKFETKGNHKICDLLPEHTIITDKQIPEAIYKLYKEHNLNLIC